MPTPKKPAARKKAPDARKVAKKAVRIAKVPVVQNRQKTGRKAPKTAFKPGQCGNPNGRPRKTEEERTLEAMCREKTPDALKAVLGIMGKGKTERSRLAAAQFVIERAWGKATQAVELTGRGGGPIESKVDATIGLTPGEVYKQLLGG